MQGFAKAGKKDAKRAEARQKVAGEDEGNAFDEEIQGIEDETVNSPPISTPAGQILASIRPIDTGTDEEMEDV